MEKVILTPRKLVLPEATTLDSNLLETYNESLGEYNEKGRQSLKIFSNKNGDLAESNCFAPLKLKEFLPKGTRLATMADLGRATEINPKFLNGFYSDTGLVLRTAGDSYENNDLLAKGLAKQLKKRGMSLREGNPKIIYFAALNLKEDKDSAYGLVYELSEEAEEGKNIFNAPELTRNYQFKTMDERGVPIEDSNGNRTLYTSEEGLSRFYLNRNSIVYSGDRDLAYSNDSGRVVAVSPEGTQKIKEKK